MKNIITIVVILLSVFLIYLGFKDQDIYYLSIGDALAYGKTPYGGKDYGYSEYIKDYLSDNDKLEVYVDDLVNPNKRTIDIINDIKNNTVVLVNGKKKTFQNVLIKADLITLSIGMNDFLNDVEINSEFSENDLYSKFETGLEDLEKLFILLREYCKENIIMVGYYNNSSELKDVISYINQKISTLANQYNIKFVKVNQELNDSKYFPNPNSRFPNKDGYYMIAKKIIELIDEKK